MARICKNILIFIGLFICSLCSDNTCVDYDDPCLCKLSEYRKINISNILPDKKDFLDTSKKDIVYYFHGCTDGHKTLDIRVNKTDTKPFNVTGSLIIHNTSSENEQDVLQLKSSQLHYSLAPDSKDDYQLVFKNGENITASIRLVCDSYKVPIFTTFGGGTKELVLAHPSACIHSEHPGMSGGSVLLILFIVGFSIYLLCGMSILYFIRGARGVEMVPNIDFWRTLPGLVRDGIIFLFNGCKPSVNISSAETYDRI